MTTAPEIARNQISAASDGRVWRAVARRTRRLRIAATRVSSLRAVVATISEPEPGRTLVESGADVETTFTVEPTVAGTRVRFDTVIDDPGLQGVLTRLFAARLLRPIYEDELERLDDYASRQSLIAA
jgi:hypothetical protein